MNKDRLVILLVCLLGMPLSVSAQIYKWTDASGKVQFSSVPPSDGVAQEIAAQRSAPSAPLDASTKSAIDEQGSGSEALGLQASALIGKWRLSDMSAGPSDWTFSPDGTFVREWKTPGWGEGRGSGAWSVERDRLLFDEKQASSSFINGETVHFPPSMTTYRVISINERSMFVKRKDQLETIEPIEFVRLQ